MALRVCPTCSATVQASDYVEHKKQHRRERDRARGSSSWSPGRNRVEQARFRREVLKRAGDQCQALVDGERCTVTEPLFAHHLEPGNDDPAMGVALCRGHHRAVDPKAR